MPNVYKSKLDIKNVRPDFRPTFIQYDHACLEIELLDNGFPYNLSTANRVEFTHVREDGSVIIQEGEIVTYGGVNIIIYEYQGTEMDLIGTIKTNFAIFDINDKKVSSHAFDVAIVKDLRDETFNPAEPNYGLLQTLLADVRDIKENGGGGSGGVGPQGPPGRDGIAGVDGYTPVKGVDYFDGIDGRDGREGRDGYTPVKGVDYFDGINGQDGINGKSAFEIAVENGFIGTETQWLESFRGPQGVRGLPGEPGYTPQKNVDYFDGQDGIDGKSAYQIAVSNGFVGTEAQWLASLKGETGPTANIDAHLSDYMPHDSGLSQYSSSVDSNGFYRVVEYRRADNTLHLKSTASNPNAAGRYQTITWQFYAANGTTLALTKTWTITYDANGVIVSKVLS